MSRSPPPRNAPSHHAAHIPLPETFHPQPACWGPRAGLREAGSPRGVCLPLGPGGTRADQGHLTRRSGDGAVPRPREVGLQGSGLRLCSLVLPASPPPPSLQGDTPTAKSVAPLVMGQSHRWWSQASQGASLSRNGGMGVWSFSQRQQPLPPQAPSLQVPGPPQPSTSGAMNSRLTEGL